MPDQVEDEPTDIATVDRSTGEIVETTPERYMNGFGGMATEPFPPEIAAKLLAPVEPEQVQIKPDGIVYLPGVWYRRRLTSSFGPGAWALAPRGQPRTDGQLVLYHGALYVLGRFISEVVGECQYHASNDTMSYASALEGARTDCLSRCCKDLGMASELWDPDWRSQWQSRYAISYRKVMQSGKWRGQERTVWRKRPTGEFAPQPAPSASPQAVPVDDRPFEPDEPPHPADVPVARARPVEPRCDLALALKINDTALRRLGWAKPHASNWLHKEFGVYHVNELSQEQAERALAALEARCSE